MPGSDIKITVQPSGIVYNTTTTIPSADSFASLAAAKDFLLEDLSNKDYRVLDPNDIVEDCPEREWQKTADFFLQWQEVAKEMSDSCATKYKAAHKQFVAGCCATIVFGVAGAIAFSMKIPYDVGKILAGAAFVAAVVTQNASNRMSPKANFDIAAKEFKKAANKLSEKIAQAEAARKDPSQTGPAVPTNAIT